MTDENAIERFVEKLRIAMINGDPKTLNEITDGNLSYGHSNGYVEGKEEFIEKLVSGISNFEKIEISDQTIKTFGNTAIVRHKFHAETNDVGKGPGAVNISILLVLQKQHDEWILIARQAVKNT